MTVPFYLLWLVQPLLEAATVVVMLRRKLHLRYPIFLSYLAYSALVTALLFSLRGNYKTYFYAYWSTNAVSVMLLLGVIYELFTTMFRQHHALRDFGTMLFRWAVVVVVMMAGLMLISSTGNGAKPLITAVLQMQRAVNVMQCGILLFLVLFSRHLGIPWKHQLFGIALGMGTAASVDAIVVSHWIRAAIGANGLNMLRMGTYCWSLTVWMIYMCMPVVAEAGPNLLLKPQRWNEALLDAANPANGPVLLGIEDLVDRTLKGSVHPMRKPSRSA